MYLRSKHQVYQRKLALVLQLNNNGSILKSLTGKMDKGAKKPAYTELQRLPLPLGEKMLRMVSD